MYRTYWTSLVLLAVFILLSIVFTVLILILTGKGILNKKFLFSTIFLLLVLFFSIYSIIPYIKDYKFISQGIFLEDTATVVEFTYTKKHFDGNGESQFSEPKFYIESKDQYIILKVSDVSLGKKYKIRYLPNTRICEILKCLD